MKVLFIWNVSAELKAHFNSKMEHLKKEMGVQLLFPSEKEVKERKFNDIADVQIVVGWKLTAEMLNNADKLLLLINPGAGVEHWQPLYKQLEAQNVTLTNCHGNAYFTAQHAVSLLLSLSNRLFEHHRFMKAGKWRTDDKEAISFPLNQRKIGLLGYGIVNRFVHQLLLGFEPNVCILKRQWNKTEKFKVKTVDIAAQLFELEELNQFLKEIDTLIIAVPNTPKTKGLIGKKELNLLGGKGSKNALLVNVGRGVVVEEKALYKALKKKKILAAGIDVWYDYSPKEDKHKRKYPYNYPFHKLDNVVLSPHRAASPMNDLGRWDSVIDNIERMANALADKENPSLLNIVKFANGY